MNSNFRTGMAGVATVLVFLTAACGGSTAEIAASEEVIASADETVVNEQSLRGSLPIGTRLRTTAALNLRTGASTGKRVLLTMPLGAMVSVIRSAPVAGWYEVSYGTARGWAFGTYLVQISDGGALPPAKSPTSVSIAGPTVRSHVQAFADAACAVVGCPLRVGTYVGHDPSADRALDLMQSFGVFPEDGGARGDNLAGYTLNNFGKHRVYYVIWKQRINTGDGRGWVAMEDRGSITQNHYDHVHVSFQP